MSSGAGSSGARMAHSRSMCRPADSSGGGARRSSTSAAAGQSAVPSLTSVDVARPQARKQPRAMTPSERVDGMVPLVSTARVSAEGPPRRRRSAPAARAESLHRSRWPTANRWRRPSRVVSNSSTSGSSVLMSSGRPMPVSRTGPKAQAQLQPASVSACSGLGPYPLAVTRAPASPSAPPLMDRKTNTP